MHNDGTIGEEASAFGERAVGDVKQATGAVTGNESLRREGQAQGNEGAARQSSNRVLTGMFRDRDSAEKAYNSAISRGYSKDDVNLLMSDQTRDTYFADGDDSAMGSKFVIDRFLSASDIYSKSVWRSFQGEYYLP